MSSKHQYSDSEATVPLLPNTDSDGNPEPENGPAPPQQQGVTGSQPDFQHWIAPNSGMYGADLNPVVVLANPNPASPPTVPLNGSHTNYPYPGSPDPVLNPGSVPNLGSHEHDPCPGSPNPVQNPGLVPNLGPYAHYPRPGTPNPVPNPGLVPNLGSHEHYLSPGTPNPVHNPGLVPNLGSYTNYPCPNTPNPVPNPGLVPNLGSYANYPCPGNPKPVPYPGLDPNPGSLATYQNLAPRMDNMSTGSYPVFQPAGFPAAGNQQQGSFVSPSPSTSWGQGYPAMYSTAYVVNRQPLPEHSTDSSSNTAQSLDNELGCTLLAAIVTTVLAAYPCGIVAIVFALRAQRQVNAGKYSHARWSQKVSVTMIMAGVFTTLIAIVTLLLHFSSLNVAHAARVTEMHAISNI
ncbi:proline-rich proteoglycan 2-like [Littorina saxatilis]|uniref:Uncharacterized protein n=1 Tax=Littorina saxatilis TaxID=31220 RepID=A0AAN9GN10_9CAEN